MAKRGREVEAELRMMETAWGTFCHELGGYLEGKDATEVSTRMGRWCEYLREEIERCRLRKDYKEDYLIRLETVRTEVVDVEASIGMILSVLGITPGSKDGQG